MKLPVHSFRLLCNKKYPITQSGDFWKRKLAEISDEFQMIDTSPILRWLSGFNAVVSTPFGSNLMLRHVPPTVKERGAYQRPLVLLLSWMMSKQQHLDKYSNLYLSKGFDVLYFKVSPVQVLRPMVAQRCISHVLDVLQEERLATRPLITHGFSVGGYLYGEMLVMMESQAERYHSVANRLVAQVFDSPVDFSGIPRGFANVLSKNLLLKSIIFNSISLYLKLTHNEVAKHYLKASTAFHENNLRLPSLFLFSKADPIGVSTAIVGIIDKWIRDGIDVSHKCWDNSPHVSHFHHHPDEYIDTLISFLESAGLVPSEDVHDDAMLIKSAPQLKYEAKKEA